MRPRILSAKFLKAGESTELTSDEAHHLLRVLRAEAGDEVELVDGKGGLTVAKIISTTKKSCTVEAIESKTSTTRSKVVLAFGIPKSNALDFILHRGTELGVMGFQPIVSQHSMKSETWNQARWERVIPEVAKQCQELFFPELFAPKKLEDWLKTRDQSRVLVFCDEEDRDKHMKLSRDAGVDILVGAEGGFSREEAKLLENKGCQRLGLGRNRLRAETASLVALTLVKQAIGEI